LLHLWGIHLRFTAKSNRYNKEIDEKQLDWVIYMDLPDKWNASRWFSWSCPWKS
jgi:hypothetical protein